MARAGIIKCVQKKTKFLCVRQIQNSIADSVHKLLSEQIEMLGLTNVFTITEKSIKCKNGSEFIFKGVLRNMKEIKSTEGVDILWVEEAVDVPRKSWKVMVNTIRKDNSEIWVSFNPDYIDDDTYQMYVVDPPKNSYSINVNYPDNPYFPEVLRIEMENDKANNKKEYEHTWLGMPHGGGGQVWPAFDKIVHVKEFKPEDLVKEGNFYMAQDPHAHYYPANGWMCVFPVNERKNWPEDFHFHIYNEWPTVADLGGLYHDQRKKLTFTGTLEDIAKEIYAGDGVEYGFKIRKRGIDTRFAKGSGGWNWSTGATLGVVEQYAKKENGGLIFTMPAEKMIDSQRQFIHKLMFHNKLIPLGQFNMPQFSVHPRCQNIIASLTNHRLEEDSEKESEKFKDYSDMMRIMFSVVEKWKDPNKRATVSFRPVGGAFG